MNNKADGYYIEVRNTNGYPSTWTSLKIDDDDITRAWLDGDTSTRTIIFKDRKECVLFSERELRRLIKFSGSFVKRIVPVKIK